MSLNQSNRVQIVFGIVQNEALDGFNPFWKVGKVRYETHKNIQDFHVRGHFFTVFKSLKKRIFIDISFKNGSTDF